MTFLDTLAEASQQFNKRHGQRFSFHYTPLHASWVNQVELWFGILQRRCLRNGTFKSVQELKWAVEAFVALWNNTDKHPFKWSFLGYQTKQQEASSCPSTDSNSTG